MNLRRALATTLTAFTLMGAAPATVLATPVLTTMTVVADEPPSFNEARSLLNDGNFRAAADAFGQIAEAQPDNGAAAFFYSYALHMDGQIEKAIPAHKRAAKFDDYTGIALYNLGCAYSLQGKIDGAFEALLKSKQAGFDVVGSAEEDSDLKNLRNDPRFAQLLGRAVEYGVEAQDEAGHDEAVTYESYGGGSQDVIDRLLGMVRQAMMAAESKWPGILTKIEQVATQIMMKVEEAMAAQGGGAPWGGGGGGGDDWNGGGDYDEAAEVAAEPAGATLNDARQLMGREDFAAAAAVLKRVVEAEPDNGAAWFNLGYCLHADGQMEKAIKVHKKAATFEPFEGIALYNLGCAYALTGQVEKAFETLILSREAGFDVLGNIDGDPDLKSVREHPGYGGLRQALANGGGL